MNRTQTRGLTGKDLMTAGLFTAVYLVGYVLISCICGVVPMMAMTMQFFSSLLLGIPMMLYFAKIKKFGMVIITYTANGLLMILLGIGAYALVFGVICALIAELILKAGKYRSFNLAVLAYAITCIGANGNAILWIVGSEEYLAKTAASMGQEYLNTVTGYFAHWWVLPAVFISAFIGGLLGGFIGRKVLRKHFVRSGIL